MQCCFVSIHHFYRGLHKKNIFFYPSLLSPGRDKFVNENPKKKTPAAYDAQSCYVWGLCTVQSLVLVNLFLASQSISWAFPHFSHFPAILQAFPGTFQLFCTYSQELFQNSRDILPVIWKHAEKVVDEVSVLGGHLGKNLRAV